MKSSKRRRSVAGRRNADGFTLLELMLVLVILVVLAGLSTFAVLSMQKTGYTRAASVEIQTLSKACKLYKLSVGSFPGSLNDLYARPNGIEQAVWGGPFIDKPIKNDPWNRPYKYTPNDANDTVMIQSAGPDGQMGSADDIPGSANQAGT